MSSLYILIAPSRDSARCHFPPFIPFTRGWSSALGRKNELVVICAHNNNAIPIVIKYASSAAATDNIECLVFPPVTPAGISLRLDHWQSEKAVIRINRDQVSK